MTPLRTLSLFVRSELIFLGGLVSRRSRVQVLLILIATKEFGEVVACAGDALGEVVH